MKNKAGRILAVLLSAAMLAATAIPAASAEETNEPVFKTAGSDSIYEGLPLFDGDPDHLDAYLDTLFEYVGEEGMMRYSLGYRGDYQLRYGENAGKIIPGAELFGDHVQGVSTDFPAILGLGNSWNEDLVEEVGSVIGTENLYTCDFLDTISNFNAVTCTALQDLRINPLSGRFDEGFSEDSYLASSLVNAMATGGSGIEEEGNEDGFWTKAIITTKHYTNYAAQYLRRGSNVSIGIRSLMDTQAKTILGGVSSGAIGGVMSSYGRTNGIPNSISPLIQWMQSFGPWTKDGGIFLLTDFSSDWQLYEDNVLSNGYDESYTPEYKEALALLMMARTTHTCANDSSSLEKPNTKYQDEFVLELENGTMGVDYEDLYLTASSAVTQLIRCGVFNERDENGYPVAYPFTEYSAGYGDVAYDSSNEEHQAVAMEAAEEAIVLLKNDNDVLPLSKDSSVVVSGPVSGARFKTTYAVGKTPDLENAGLSIGAGIKTVGGEENVTNLTDGNIIAFKSELNGKYFVAGEGGVMTASADTAEEASHFEAYAWGQDNGYSYLCVDEGENNGKWIKFEAPRNGSPTLTVTGDESLNVTETGLSATSYSITLPSRFSLQANDNDTSSLLLNCYSESFFSSTNIYYGTARLLAVSEDGTVGCTDAVSDASDETAKRAEAANQITIETVQEAGTETIAADADYAVVVVGAPTRHSAGEGADRSDLALGADQYELVENVAAAYPGKTIVVINGCFPFAVDEIQNNENVASIVFMPYGGQYDGYAMGKTIYGDSVPTGKLTSTWYASMDALPEEDEYTLPQGYDQSYQDKMPPRYHTDFSNGDAQETGLTYQYTDADVTYEFGYGISYTTFEYSGLNVSAQKEDGSFDVSLTVTNTGDTDSAEIVQLYASNPNSSYGKYAPKKFLVGFDKVDLKAGESKTVTMTVSADDLARWNTNSGSYEIESGTYQFMAAASSEDIRATAEVAVSGSDYGTLNLSEPVNVFERSYAANDVVYLEYSKKNTSEGLRDDVLLNGYSVVMGKWEGSWVVMNNVDLDNVESFIANVAYNGEGLSGIELRVDSPDGEKIAEFIYSPTDPITYTVDSVEPYEVTELGYEDVSSNLLADVSGVHDVYVVFKNAEARINTLQAVMAEEPTETPDSTEKPDPTEKPDSTEKPDPTEKPDSSEKPNPTEKPDSSEKPNPTEKPDSETPGEQPQTGDSFAPLFAVLFTVAAAGAAAVTVIIRRRKQNIL